MPTKKLNNQTPDNSQPGKKQVAAGFRPIPIFGLEQTEPAPATVSEKVYHPLYGETEEVRQIFSGYRVPWWKWFEGVRAEVFRTWNMKDEPQPNFELAATLGAAVIAKLRNEPTELADLLTKLKSYKPQEVAEYIDTAAAAVERYLC